MVVLGALLNGIEAFVGGMLGLMFKRHVSPQLGDFLTIGQGLCVVMIAVQGMAAGGSAIVAVISVAVGGLIGFVLDIDAAVRRFGDRVQAWLDKRFSGSSTLGSFSEGFVASTLLICVGAMAVVGALQSGMHNDHSTLISKGVIDLILLMVMATTLGIGVPFGGVVVFVYEALLSLGASALAPMLSQAVVAEMSCTGSLLLLAIGLNLLKLTDIKAANLLPAAFMPIAVVPLLAATGLM